MLLGRKEETGQLAQDGSLTLRVVKGEGKVRLAHARLALGIDPPSAPKAPALLHDLISTLFTPVSVRSSHTGFAFSSSHSQVAASPGPLHLLLLLLGMPFLL